MTPLDRKLPGLRKRAWIYPGLGLLLAGLVATGVLFFSFQPPVPPTPAPLRVGIQWTPQDPTLGVVPSIHAQATGLTIFTYINGVRVTDRFPTSKINRIDIWLDLKFPPSDYENQFELQLVVYDPDGGLLSDSGGMDFTIQAGQTKGTEAFALVWSNPEATRMRPGIYNVEIYSGPVLIVNRAFEITDN